MKLVTFENPADRAKGLQFLKRVDPGTVFLFMDIPAGAAFHTRNVPQPIDIGFLSEDLVVIDVVTVPPGKDGISVPPGTAAVLEAVPGVLAKCGFVPGKSFSMSSVG